MRTAPRVAWRRQACAAATAVLACFPAGAAQGSTVAAQGSPAAPTPSGRAVAQTPSGQGLAEALGCGACHAGMPGGERIRRVSPALGSSAIPLAPAYVFHYLASPRTVRPQLSPSRMPAYDLDERQRLALALFATNEIELRGVDDAFRDAQSRHPGVDRGEGRILFAALGCGGCHSHPDAPEHVAAAPDLALESRRVRQEWLRSYLAAPVAIRPAGARPGTGDQMPDFRLDPAEVEALARFLTFQTDRFLNSQAAPEFPPWTPAALSPFAMRKAEVLLRDRWSCLGCHQLGDDGGRIGPRLDGVAHRLRPDYLRAMIEDPSHLAPGTIMPGSFEQQDRLDLIASYLLRREAPWKGSARVGGLPMRPHAASASASLGAGETIYRARCAPCHGQEGGGDGFNAPYLPVPPTVHRDSAAISLRPDDTLYDGIYAGGWILGKSHRMPAFGPSMSDGELRAVVAYIRELCGCRGPSWSRDGRRGL